MAVREVVVISSDTEEARLIKQTLEGQGCDVRLRAGLSQALRALKGTELVLLGLDGDNSHALKEIKSYYPDSVVLVAAERVTAGMREGAFGFIHRPMSEAGLAAAVRGALEFLSLQSEVRRLKNAEAPSMVVGKNKKMLKVKQQAQRAAAKHTPLLVLGPEGSGRETLARSVQSTGPRVVGPFVVVEDPAQAGEGGIFGKLTARGVTGGALVEAAGGTVLISDVETADPEVKKKLGRFLKEKQYIPQGGSEHVRPDVRVICTADRLDKNSSLFKSFRHKIQIPPLGQRAEDVLPMAEHFMRTACASQGAAPKKFSKDAKDYMAEHGWPGNVTELKNAVKKACLLADGPQIERRHLASGSGAAYCSIKDFLEDKLSGYLKGMAKVGNAGLHDTVTGEVEKSLIELVLRETGGNQMKASKLLGLNRNTLRSKIKLYKIKNGK